MTEADETQEAAGLWRLLPAIRRAREYHLYDHRGRRYLDLCLLGGRALMGHRPDHILLLTKNELSKGLAGDFPSPHERRLIRAIARILPGYETVRIYANMERLRSALAGCAGAPPPEAPLPDPALEPVAGAPAALWRPFLPEQPRLPPILLPVLPFPAAFAPALLCAREEAGRELPPSDLVSPALLAGLTASIYALLGFGEHYGEEEWRRLDGPLWDRRGPYLRARCKKAQYPALFRRLLEEGVLISPEYPGPSIVPALVSRGEIEPLRRIAGE